MRNLYEFLDRTPSAIKEFFPNPLLRRIDSAFDYYYLYNPTTYEIRLDGREWEMYLPPNHSPWQDYATNKCHEPITTRTLQQELDEDSVFWDIGSYFGYFPVAALETTDIRGENIHVFEPDQWSIGYITNNVERLDDHVNVNSYGLGDGNDGLRPGDEYSQSFGCPTAVKIDVDGHEGHVLQGMKQTLLECKPTLLLEVHFVEEYDDIRQEVVKQLDGYNDIKICYNHRDMNANWTRIPSPDYLPKSESDTPDDCVNSFDYIAYAD